MVDNFYRDFEARFRTSSNLLKKDLSQYFPFIQPLAGLYPTAKILDIGCGRGEWLELMQAQNFTVFGIDLDKAMLQVAIDKGLPVSCMEAIAYLTSLDNESHVIISAFHVVEHICFEEIRTLVREALRVLKPGGLLIMETPNPENLIVGTRNFYIDPSHKKPIPLELLAFLPEYYGYKRIKLCRFQEPLSREYVESNNITLNNVLEGASPDYGIVAQKDASEEVLKLNENSFLKDYGVPLSTLAEQYDKTITRKINEIALNILKENSTINTISFQFLTKKLFTLASVQLKKICTNWLK